MIKTILIFAFVGLTVIGLMPFGLIALLLSFLGLRKPMTWFTYYIAKVWARILFLFSGCAITAEGRENIPRKGGVCLVCNHGSIFDIVLNLAFVGRPFGFVAKKELALIPLLNAWIAMLGGLFIDRKHPRKGLKTINKGAARLKAGGGILIFPEGHRSRDQGLLPFKPGAFKLAIMSGVPIIPVSITGSYNVFERDGRVRAVPVRIVFGAPIVAGELPTENRKQALSDQVRVAIEAGLVPVQF